MFVVFPHERRRGISTTLSKSDGAEFLGVKTLNLQKTSILEKGIGQVLIEGEFRRAIKKNWSKESFDLILYTTPPVTLLGVVKYLKKKYPKALSYLLLKDIFPQNAVDLGLFRERGVINWYFRNKEKALYKSSDYIGCMSPANVDFILKHNPEISPDRIEVAPNSIELSELNELMNDPGQKKAANFYIKKKYDLPLDKPIFIYGGNLGKPQGIDYLIRCLEANKDRIDCFFVIIGSGTEYPRLHKWYSENRLSSVKLMNSLPKDEYDLLIKACDVGLIFWDHRFTIPNYPSRLLSYLENKMPVICATDPNTDIGRIAEDNGYGYWCESNSIESFTSILDRMIHSERKLMGEKGYVFLKENYLVQNTYNAIIKHFE